MFGLSQKIRQKQQQLKITGNPALYKEAFRNEDGAIDLASIMVGIIVIGLIGGVIAATVFAVIPWSQDNAAKHQLESIHNAQNAYHGLSSDPSYSLPDGKRNSFTNSAGLEGANLLITGPAYCTVATPDGKDYTAYAASASGTVFASSNTDKQAKPVTGVITGNCSFLNASDEGGATSPTPTPEPTPPPAPVYTQLQTHDFEALTTGWTNYFVSSDYINTSNSSALSGRQSLFVQTIDSGSTTVATYVPRVSLEVGKTYRVTFLARTNSSTGGGGVKATSGTFASNTIPNNTEATVTLDFVPTRSSQGVTITALTNGGAYDRPILYVDDVKLERVD